MKGYKGFDPDFKCNSKQYEENTEYEEKGGTICGAGVMHFCETPLDVLDYYPVLNDNCKFNRFAEVTALDDVQAEGNKRATKKIKIGAEFSLRDFIKAAVSVCIERTGQDAKASGYYSQLAASGDSSKLAASGYYSQLAASGNYSVVAGIGINNIAKCALGGFIVLAEWVYENGRYIPINVKAAKVDGEAIKPDTWYRLVNGEFVEVDAVV